MDVVTCAAHGKSAPWVRGRRRPTDSGPHRRGVDGRLTLLALLLVLVPQVANLFRVDLSALLPAFAQVEPGRSLLVTLGALCVVSLALGVLEAVARTKPPARSVRAHTLFGLNVLLRLAQGGLGALLGIIGGVVATVALSGQPDWLYTVSLWLATFLLVLIVALPFLYDRLARPAVGVLALPERSAGAAVAQVEDINIAPGPNDSRAADTSAVESDPPQDLGVRRGAAQVVVLGAFGLDLLLYSLVVPFLPREAQRLGATPLATGILFAMYAAGLFAATPLAAWLTDRIGPRPTLLWGLVALGCSTLLFAFSPTLALGLPGLFGARAAQGVASSITWTAGLTVLAHLNTAEERRRSFARAFTVTGLSTLIGPPLGGALYSWGGFMLPFLVATGLVVLDGLGRLLFLPGNEALPTTRPEAGSTRGLLRDPGVQLGLFAAIAGALALSSLEPGTPLLLGQVFGMPAWGVGAVFGALALCFVLMQPVMSSTERRLGTSRTLALGLLVTALCFAGITLASGIASEWWSTWVLPIDLLDLPPVTGVLAALAVAGCALALALTPVPDLLARRGERLTGEHGAAYGAIYAGYNAAYALGVLLGPLATGAAIATQGIVRSFLLLAIPPVVCALVLLAWGTRIR